MEKHEFTQLPGTLTKLKISEVIIPQEMSSLYDYTCRQNEIDTLKTSIEEFGQLEPVTVVKVGNQYLIVNGVLRLMVLSQFHLIKNEIDAIVLNIDTTSVNFNLMDLIIHTQIQKVKTAKEKIREFISILRLESGDDNPLRDRNQRYDFLTSSLGKGWSRSNVILMSNVILWTIQHGDELNLVEQVFEGKILISQAAFAIETLARDDYGYEKEKESKILSKFLKGEFKKEKTESLIDVFNYKRNEGFTSIDVYPIKTKNYEVIHGSIEEIQLPTDMEIDVVFTSPPYYKLRHYGDDPNEMGWEKTPQLYAERLVDSLMKPFERLKSSGNFFLNLGETYDKGQCLAVIEHVVIEMVKRGAFYVDRIIWKKDSNKPVSNQNHRFQPSYEVVLHFSKSKDYYFDRFKIKKEDNNFEISRGCKDYGWAGVNYYVPNFYKQLRTIMSENDLKDIVTVQTNTQRIKHVEDEDWHPATFSQMLPAIFLATYCPKPTEKYTPLIFDPFLGGASCGRTALMMGFRFVGVELYEKNVITSKRILAESVMDYEPRAMSELNSFMEYELVA